MSCPYLGVNLPIAAGPAVRMAALVRHAEHLGFDFVSVNDHPEGTDASFEAWMLLTWAAAHTHRINVATRVIGVPYRSPALLANMASTLSQLRSR